LAFFSEINLIISDLCLKISPKMSNKGKNNSCKQLIFDGVSLQSKIQMLLIMHIQGQISTMYDFGSGHQTQTQL
jgi:hypothetical protein